MRGLLVEPLGRPRFFTPSGNTAGAGFVGFDPAGENGPEEPCGIAGEPVADDTGTNASDMDPSGPCFLGRPLFFFCHWFPHSRRRHSTIASSDRRRGQTIAVGRALRLINRRRGRGAHRGEHRGAVRGVRHADALHGRGRRRPRRRRRRALWHAEQIPPSHQPLLGPYLHGGTAPVSWIEL
uniref:Uncharacterized protein n=1 Tax=Arundo donax TaxID=35708 RepID=A0A0A9CVW3_ARUDO